MSEVGITPKNLTIVSDEQLQKMGFQGNKLSLEDAKTAAKNLAGSEAIVDNKDGTYSLYSLAKESTEDVTLHKIAKEDPNVVSFQIEKKFLYLFNYNSEVDAITLRQQDTIQQTPNKTPTIESSNDKTEDTKTPPPQESVVEPEPNTTEEYVKTIKQNLETLSPELQKKLSPQVNELLKKDPKTLTSLDVQTLRHEISTLMGDSKLSVNDAATLNKCNELVKSMSFNNITPQNNEEWLQFDFNDLRDSYNKLSPELRSKLPNTADVLNMRPDELFEYLTADEIKKMSNEVSEILKSGNLSNNDLKALKEFNDQLSFITDCSTGSLDKEQAVAWGADLNGVKDANGKAVLPKLEETLTANGGNIYDGDVGLLLEECEKTQELVKSGKLKLTNEQKESLNNYAIWLKDAAELEKISDTNDENKATLKNKIAEINKQESSQTTKYDNLVKLIQTSNKPSAELLTLVGIAANEKTISDSQYKQLKNLVYTQGLENKITQLNNVINECTDVNKKALFEKEKQNLEELAKELKDLKTSGQFLWEPEDEKETKELTVLKIIDENFVVKGKCDFTINQLNLLKDSVKDTGTKSEIDNCIKELQNTKNNPSPEQIKTVLTLLDSIKTKTNNILNPLQKTRLEGAIASVTSIDQDMAKKNVASLEFDIAALESDLGNMGADTATKLTKVDELLNEIKDSKDPKDISMKVKLERYKELLTAQNNASIEAVNKENTAIQSKVATIQISIDTIDTTINNLKILRDKTNDPTQQAALDDLIGVYTQNRKDLVVIKEKAESGKELNAEDFAKIIVAANDFEIAGIIDQCKDKIKAGKAREFRDLLQEYFSIKFNPDLSEEDRAKQLNAKLTKIRQTTNFNNSDFTAFTTDVNNRVGEAKDRAIRLITSDVNHGNKRGGGLQQEITDGTVLTTTTDVTGGGKVNPNAVFNLVCKTKSPSTSNLSLTIADQVVREIIQPYVQNAFKFREQEEKTITLNNESTLAWQNLWKANTELQTFEQDPANSAINVSMGGLAQSQAMGDATDALVAEADRLEATLNMTPIPDAKDMIEILRAFRKILNELDTEIRDVAGAVMARKQMNENIREIGDKLRREQQKYHETKMDDSLKKQIESTTQMIAEYLKKTELAVA